MSADGSITADQIARLAVRAAAREPLHRRTFMPVRRHSVPVGRHLAGEALTWDEVGRRAAALSQIARSMPRDPGRRRGCAGTLSVWAEPVYRVLASYAARNAGQVFPSYATLADKAGCSIRTVARCLRQLRDFGWLEWIRRFEVTGEKGVRGPQVQQISNFYRVTVPKAARELLAKWSRRRQERGGDGEAEDRARREAFRQECEAIARREDLEAAHRAQEAKSPVLARAAAKCVAEQEAAIAALSSGGNANDSKADNPGSKSQI